MVSFIFKNIMCLRFLCQDKVHPQIKSLCPVVFFKAANTDFPALACGQLLKSTQNVRPNPHTTVLWKQMDFNKKQAVSAAE